MTKIGTIKTKSGRKALLLGSGELGKEVALELQRMGVEVIACDKYEGAPAMQVAHRAYVFDMLDGNALRQVVEKEKPDHIIPEVEAIATSTLVELEKEGYNVTPTARATWLTMNREGIRRLAAEELGLPTSPYVFASDKSEFDEAVKQVGIPCVVKPVMSSSGHGQTIIRTPEMIEEAWEESQHGGRSGAGRVIVEGFVDFDYEITLLTVRSISGTIFCKPIGHIQVNGDYRYSWQPQPMSEIALNRAREIARKITDALGGYGIFGVELFVKGDDVIFSEVSPRPHDTGMVTMISQDLSEFALHVRALLGLPVPAIDFYGPSASRAVVVEGKSKCIEMDNLEKVLEEPGTQMRIFAKPEINGHRRMAVILARGASVEDAREKAERAYNKLKVTVKDQSPSKIIIAIDGYSSSGKSTMARQLASAIGYRYVDSGAMYRAVTLYALRNGMIAADGTIDVDSLVNALPSIKIDFTVDGTRQLTTLNGEIVEDEIREMAVSSHVSPVAAIPEVRHRLVELQQQFGRERGIVMDGRDIGSTVFPDAELKIFVDASPEKRAMRRLNELTDKGVATTYEEVLANVVERDHIDRTRSESPLRKVDDAVVLDNSEMTLDEQNHILLDLYNQTVERLKA